MNTKHSSGKQSDPVTACLKQNAGAKGYKKLQYTQKYHFEPVLWWRSGAKAQVLDHGQVQPAFVSGNIGDVAYPGLIWLFKVKLTLTQIWGHRIAMVGVCGGFIREYATGFLRSRSHPFASLFVAQGAILRLQFPGLFASRFCRSACLGEGAPAAFNPLRSVSRQIPSSAATSLLGRPRPAIRRITPSLNSSSYHGGAIPFFFSFFFPPVLSIITNAFLSFKMGWG